jgi:mono/diheme cytochrome c family protein
MRAGVLAGLGVVVLSGSAWLGGAVAAQQKPAAKAGAAAAPATAVGTTGNVEHGRYLVESVAMCGECHSTRDQAGNIVPGTKLKGGPMPARVPWASDGNAWPIMAPSIAGLPAYSDIQATRLLTQGAIRRDGTQARAPMPRFHMSAQDAADVIAFLRTQ